MQIHELNTFVGTPSATDYLAIDDGEETNKVPATALGVSTQMTQAEAEAGTITAPRVVSPSVFKASVESIAETVAETREVLVVNVASFSSLPQVVTNSNITSDMVVVNSVLGTPSSPTSDWTVTAADGSATIAGSISGSTTLTLYLMKSGTPMAVSTIPNTHGNKVLWSGAAYMGAGVNATLSEPISKQRTGIVLVWSAYEGGRAQNYDIAFHFVPKEKISNLSEVGANFPLGTANFSKLGCKYLYFQDSLIRGYSSNDQTGTGSGVTYANNYWVLRQVLGV